MVNGFYIEYVHYIVVDRFQLTDEVIKMEGDFVREMKLHEFNVFGLPTMGSYINTI